MCNYIPYNTKLAIIFGKGIQACEPVLDCIPVQLTCAYKAVGGKVHELYSCALYIASFPGFFLHTQCGSMVIRVIIVCGGRSLGTSTYKVLLMPP